MCDILKRKLKKVTGALEPVMTVIPDHPLENKRGKIRKVVYGYDKVGVEGAFGQIRDHIVVEASSLGKSHPSEIVSVHSMITAFIATTNNVDLINAYHLEPFKVRVLSIERTFCEKIISLVRFSYTENPLEDLTDKVRHTYDLHQLLQQDKIASFLQSDDFEKMLLQVGKDDDKAIPNDKEWLLKHPSQSLFFSQYALNKMKKAPSVESLQKVYIHAIENEDYETCEAILEFCQGKGIKL